RQPRRLGPHRGHLAEARDARHRPHRRRLAAVKVTAVLGLGSAGVIDHFSFPTFSKRESRRSETFFASKDWGLGVWPDEPRSSGGNKHAKSRQADRSRRVPFAQRKQLARIRPPVEVWRVS